MVLWIDDWTCLRMDGQALWLQLPAATCRLAHAGVSPGSATWGEPQIYSGRWHGCYFQARYILPLSPFVI